MNQAICGKHVRLRDLIEKDMEDYQRWFVTEAEWQKWDAPWERNFDASQSYIDRLYHRLKKEPLALRGRLEIEAGNVHIGWVTSYLICNNADFLAVGISIAEASFWGRGFGKEALTLWIEYLFKARKPEYIYCETWSGNVRMIKLAQNLGFEIVERYCKIEVDGNEYHKLKFRISRIIV